MKLELKLPEMRRTVGRGGVISLPWIGIQGLGFVC